MTDFELSDGERMSPFWQRLKAHLVDRLALARQRNDASLHEQHTAELRGEIKVLKRLILLDGPPLPAED